MAVARAGDILSRSLRVVWQDYPAFLLAVGPPLLVGALLSYLASVVLGPDLASLQQAAAGSGSSVPAVLGPYLLKTTAFVVAAGLLLAVAAFRAIRATLAAPGLRGDPAELPSEPAGGLAAFVLTSFAVGAMVLAVLLLGTILIFLVLPFLGAIAGAVYLLLRWALAPVAVALEDLGVAAGLERSGEITEEHRRSLLGILAVLALALVVPTAGLQGLLGLAGLGSSSALKALAGLVVQLVVVPWGTAALVLAHAELAEIFHEKEMPIGDPT